MIKATANCEGAVESDPLLGLCGAVVASEKGVVVGRLTFTEDGDAIDCSKIDKVIFMTTFFSPLKMFTLLT